MSWFSRAFRRTPASRILRSAVAPVVRPQSLYDNPMGGFGGRYGGAVRGALQGALANPVSAIVGAAPQSPYPQMPDPRLQALGQAVGGMVGFGGGGGGMRPIGRGVGGVMRGAYQAALGRQAQAQAVPGQQPILPAAAQQQVSNATLRPMMRAFRGF